MFSIRNPQEGIVLDLLAQGPHRDRILYAKLKERMKTNEDISEGLRQLAYCLLRKNPETFRQMMERLEEENKVRHTDSLVLEKSEWDPERQFVASRIYELAEGSRQGTLDVMRYMKTA